VRNGYHCHPDPKNLTRAVLGVPQCSMGVVLHPEECTSKKYRIWCNWYDTVVPKFLTNISRSLLQHFTSNNIYKPLVNRFAVLLVNAAKLQTYLNNFMCVDWYDRYVGCSQRGFQTAECGFPTHHPCKSPHEGCKVTKRGEWHAGVCPYHLQRLKDKDRRREEKILVDRDKRWDKGERRVWTVEGERPSKWHSEPNCVVL
jgi:hypothetical protein